MKIKLSHIVLLIFTLYGMNHFIFERTFYFNELLSLIGLGYFLLFSFRKSGKFIIPCSKIYKLVLGIIALMLFYALISISLQSNWYFYFRNLSLIYSAFSFFIGFYLYQEQKSFYGKSKLYIYGYSFGSFAIGNPMLMDRNAYGFWFALLQRNWKVYGLIFFSALFVLYTLAFSSMTVVMIYLIVMFTIIIRKYWMLKLSLFLAILAVACLMYISASSLELYQHGGYRLFGNVLEVYGQHQFFNIDHNSSWRLLLWYRLLVEQFPENLLGIGIGTPLLPYKAYRITTELGHPDEYIAHVIGAHNTFITMFCRFGIGFLVLIGMIYRLVFKEFYTYREYYSKNHNDFSIFMAFITITTVGVFNLLLETPTLASVFWILLGFVARAIYQRKLNHNEV